MRNKYSAVSVDLPCQYKERWLPSPSLSAEIQLKLHRLVRLLALQRHLPFNTSWGQFGPQQCGLYNLLSAFLCRFAASSSLIPEACLHWSDHGLM